MNELGLKDASIQTTSKFPQPAAGSAGEYKNNLKALEVVDYRLLEAGSSMNPDKGFNGGHYDRNH
jgi:hypothetical protein